MTSIIEDGTGNSFKAKVDGNNRLHTQSVIVSASDQANEKGLAYNINTGVITLTSDVATPVIYLKNNETANYHLANIAVALGPSANGDNSMTRITLIKNPSTGTIISNASDVDINTTRNFGSAQEFSADVYRGATGNTMTDGTNYLLYFLQDDNRLFASTDTVIPGSKTIGVKIQPPAGNTSMELYVAFVGYLLDVENED